MLNDFSVIIVGAGPAGLMAAQILAEKGFQVQVFEQNKAAARKFLVAGNGGFNLTHSEDLHTFIQKYDAAEIQQMVTAFDNQQVISWLADLGIDTFVGSSGKIFPTKDFKPIHVLKAWLDRLEKLGVLMHYENTFVNFDEKYAHFDTRSGPVQVAYSKLILGLGGASWKKTGSDAKWVRLLAEKEINIQPLEPANSGYDTAAVYHDLQGQYLKNIQLSFGKHHKTGELVFTKYGVEGSPVYYLNRFTRNHGFPLTLHIDLKPQLSETEIVIQLQGSEKRSPVLKKKLKLSTTALNLLKTLDKETYTDAGLLAQHIKRFPIEVLGFRPIDEVISTAGGISFAELTPQLEFRRFPNVFAVGEMINWEAPTGGYLLQACFSMGSHVAAAIATPR